MKSLNESDLSLVAGGDQTTENLTLAGAIGAGVGASKLIARAGGLAALSESLMLPVSAATISGLAASAVAGYRLGTAIYENSETVRNGAEKVVGSADKWIGTYATFFGTFGKGGWGTTSIATK